MVAPGISIVPCVGLDEKSANQIGDIKSIILLKIASLKDRSNLPLLSTPKIAEFSGCMDSEIVRPPDFFSLILNQLVLPTISLVSLRCGS